jgi:hypothetical protein
MLVNTGPGMEDRHRPLAVENHGADQVGGQEIRGELDPAAVQPEGLGERLGQGGLAYPGEIFNEEMAPRGHAGERQPHDLALAVEDGSHVGRHIGQLLGQRPGGTLGLGTAVAGRSHLADPRGHRCVGGPAPPAP